MALPRQTRRAARVIVIDEVGQVLLLKGCDPARPEAGTWWLTPGGGLEDGETFEQAGFRELHEETGLALGSIQDLGDRVSERAIEFEFEGVIYDQTQVFFVVRTTNFELDRSGWTELENRSVLDHRWWSRTELQATADAYFPDDLLELMPR